MLERRLKAAEQKWREGLEAYFKTLTHDELVYFVVHGYPPGTGGPEATPEHIAECARVIEAESKNERGEQ